MAVARPRFRRAVFLLLNGNFDGFDSTDNGDVRLLWSGKSLEGADNGGPCIRNGQEKGNGAAPVGQLPALTAYSGDKAAERRDDATTD